MTVQWGALKAKTQQSVMGTSGRHKSVQTSGDLHVAFDMQEAIGGVTQPLSGVWSTLTWRCRRMEGRGGLWRASNHNFQIEILFLEE